MQDSLGDRMKDYEDVNRFYLTKRSPVLLRIDGKSHHTFTKKMDKPFDEKYIECIQKTMVELTKNIDTCYFSYCQSDEISLLLTNYKTINTGAWFDNNLQKIVSISSSMATAYFNKFYQEIFNDEKIAMFDSRAFILPKEEVVNYFIWRQQDCTRNSIQMLGRSEFSHKELHKKSCDDIQEMLFTQKNINYNDISTYKKRGSCCYYNTEQGYILDKEIPIFTQDRNYIQRFVDIDKDNKNV